MLTLPPNRKDGINFNFSLYLDLIRISAAVAVFLNHLESYPFTNNSIWKGLGSYGAIAVTIFFILSGYVIAHVVYTKEKTLTAFAVSRISRLYSVVIVGLLLTLILDLIGSNLNPDYYAIDKIFHEEPNLTSYLASLFFVNEFQIFNFDGISPGSNGPYWSLSFEATYYILAGIILFLPKMLSVPISILILAIAGSTISILAPLWILGFLTYFVGNINLSHRYLILISIFSLFGILATPLVGHYIPESFIGLDLPFGRGPFQRHIIKDYVASVFFVLHMLSTRSILNQYEISLSKRTINLIRWLGNITFPLYIFHFPLLAFFGSISPFGNDGFLNAAYLTTVTILIVALGTPITDRLKILIKESISLVISERSNPKFAK